ncbi:hypothetical protein Tco_1475005 [Tanacetum coccineum]
MGKNERIQDGRVNALPRKEYERVFMCKTVNEVWHTLIITHQGNSQVKNYKIDLLTQEYEKFSISNEETINSGFTRVNAIMTSLKSLDPDYSSKNHLRSLGSKLVIIVIVKIEATKTLMKKKLRHSIYWLGTSVRVIGSDAEINLVMAEIGSVKAAVIASSKGGESSKKKEAYYNCVIEGHFASECRNPKENKAFMGEAWSDSEDGDKHQNDATYLMAINS